LKLFVLVVLLIASACSKSNKATKPPNVDYYTCTMHPSVKPQVPNRKCPSCSMDLVPVLKKSGGETKPAASPQMQETKGGQMQGMSGMQGMKGGGELKASQTSEFVVPVERQQQIGVTYAAVAREPLHHTIRSVGIVVPDKGRNWQFVSRVDGYVQKLDVKSPGEIVEKDAPLLSIYSLDLLTSEREFVELLRMRDEAKSKEARETPDRLIQSAKRRLRLWNVTDEQITELQQTRNPRENLTL